MAPRCPSSQASTRPGSACEAAAAPQQSQFYRTKMCPFHLKHEQKNPRYRGLFALNVGLPEGTCVTGSRDCRFAHSLRELRPLPDLTRTKLCASYQREAACTLQNCPFAHSPDDLRTSSSIFYKVSLCNFYRANKCWNGENCRFAHGNQELREHLELMRRAKCADFSKAMTSGTAATPGCSWALNPTETAPPPLRETTHVSRLSDVHPALRRHQQLASMATATTQLESRIASYSHFPPSASDHDFFVPFAPNAADEPSLEGSLDDAAEELLRLVLDLDLDVA